MPWQALPRMEEGAPMQILIHKGTLRRCEACRTYSLHPERCK